MRLAASFSKDQHVRSARGQQINKKKTLTCNIRRLHRLNDLATFALPKSARAFETTARPIARCDWRPGATLKREQA